MQTDLKTLYLTGNELAPYLNDLADLRLKVFYEFPYLYDGNLSYEMQYLTTYSRSSNSRVMLIYDGKKLIGATTSIPLKEEELTIQNPFIKQGLNPADYFYLGEALLLPEYRGQRIYRLFFTFRENAGKEQGYKKTVFMAVIRPEYHPRRPVNYQPLDVIWTHFGYHCISGLQIYYSWKDTDNAVETEKALSVWEKDL